MDSSSESLAKLIAALSRTHAALVAGGDERVADLGLSSAREQLLGALSASGSPRTVSQLARALGLTRQAVQRVADDMVKAGLATYRPNPDHARAKLLTPTEAGAVAYAEALRRKALWRDELAAGLPIAGVEIAAELVALLGRRAGRKGVKTGVA